LSHSDFMLAWDCLTDDTSISVNCVDRYKNLVAAGLCEIEIYDTRAAVKPSSQLLTALRSVQSRHNQKLFIKKTASDSASKSSASKSTEVAALLAKQVKMANPAYRAVVDGKKARRDFIQEYAAALSPIDRPDFWRGVMEMSDAEKATLASQLARRPHRGR
jgi:hypothetical protein